MLLLFNMVWLNALLCSLAAFGPLQVHSQSRTEGLFSLLLCVGGSSGPAGSGSPFLSTLCFCIPDFLGRTEIRVADIKKDQGSKGPVTKCLLLHEVPTGEIVVRLDLQLFDEP